MSGIKSFARGTFIALALPTLAVTALASAGGTRTYKAKLLTPAFSAMNAAAMNSQGDVVGTSDSPTVRGWASIGGAPAFLLPLPPGALSSWATDINDSGVIVGAASPLSSPEFMGTAVAWVPVVPGAYMIVEYGALPGHVRSNATALNDVGDVVGWSSDGTFRHPVLFLAQAWIEDLSATGIFDPIDVNDERQVVDQSFTCRRLDLDTMVVEDLGAPAGDYVSTRCEAINELGQAAGSARLTTGTNCDRQAARFDDESGWDILSVCGAENSAYDINDFGDVIMRLNLAPYVRFEGEGTFLVESLISEQDGHWFVINGFGLAINDARQLAVPATNESTGESGIILLTPLAGADLNGDDAIDGADVAAVLGQWGERGVPADLNGDGVVDGGDITVILGAWTG